jgi:hypothetical protein
LWAEHAQVSQLNQFGPLTSDQAQELLEHFQLQTDLMTGVTRLTYADLPSFEVGPKIAPACFSPYELRRKWRRETDFKSAMFSLVFALWGLAQNDPYLYGAAILAALVGVARMFIAPRKLA